MTDTITLPRATVQQALEACPFCGNEPSFSGDASEWKDDYRYVELSLGCCVSMTEQIGWRRAREMTHEAKTAELRSRLQLRWNTRAALEQQQAEPCQYCGLSECDPKCMWIEQAPQQQAEPVVDEAIHAAWSAGYVEGEKAVLEQQTEPVQETEAFGFVTVRRLSQRFENHHDQYQFYPAGQIPYLDNVDECHTVYTAPPQRKELSAGEILNMMPSAIPAEYDGELMEFARAVEAKTKEET